MDYIGFDWDEGNERKNDKHGVTKTEIEQVFLNAPLVVADDVRHSKQERRYYALGRTDANRWIHVPYTERNAQTLIRPISARDMSRKEKAVYAEAFKKNS